MTSEVLSNVSVALVETAHPGNIGSAARALKNMGFSRLKLVSPPKFPASEATRMAVGAEDLLERTQIFGSLDQALADENLVIGTTSGRGRGQHGPIYSSRQIGEMVCRYARSQRVCLVFGPERTGLSEEQLARCGHLVTVPAAEEAPTLNLAQAVLLLAYEVATSSDSLDSEKQEVLPLAPNKDVEAMYSQVESVLIDIGFLSQSNPGHIMRSIRRLFGRAGPSPRDIRIIRGIMSQMEWFIEEGRHQSPDQVRKP